MIWSFAGLALSLAVAAAGWLRSRTPGGFYDSHVYGMTPAMHRRYAFVSLAFAAYFVVTLGLHADFAGIAGLAVCVLIAIFYGTSFLRGFADDE